MADHVGGRTVKQCVYEGCRWEYEEVLPDAPVSVEVGWLHPAAVLRQVHEATEAACRAHLDADHPGWTMTELEDRARLRPGR